MKITCRVIFASILAIVVCVAFASIAQAATAFSNMSSAGFRVINGAMGPLGGSLSSADSTLIATNMLPFQQGLTQAEYMPYFDNAVVDLNGGKNFRNSLMLTATLPADSGIGRLIKYKEENYENAKTDPKLLANLAAVEASLVNARDVFAYGVHLGVTGAKDQLLDTIKTLATIYLMIGDEFLIDALEYRFSANTLGIEERLEEQICLLGYGKSNPEECAAGAATSHGAQYYYQKAVQSFVYGFLPASIGKDVYISEFFEDSVLSLFNLSSERLSAALREKSSKQFLRLLSPDPNQEWVTARQAAVKALKNDLIGNYLAAAVAADNASKRGVDFSVNGGEILVTNLEALSKQGRLINDSNMNLLGYDKRHVPMYPLENLLPFVQADILAASSAQGRFETATREMDASENAMRQELNSLIASYTSNLFLLTGCTAPNLEDPASVDDFEICVVSAGDDLLSCDVNKSVPEFNACVSSMSTKQSVKARYENIMAAKQRLDLARLNRQNILEQIKLETALHKELIKIKQKATDQQYVLLEDYFDRLKNARSEMDTVTYTSTRSWDKAKNKWSSSIKTKVHTTTESFNADDALKINTDKEKDFLAATTKYEIQSANAELDNKIKNLLLNEAAAEIEVQIAAQQKNVAVGDFDDAIEQKKFYWTLFRRSLQQIQDYYYGRIPTQRVLKSQAAIDLSSALNRAAHSGYLAAKALEYKYVSPIENQSLPGGNISMSDLFKAQTPTDLQDFLDGLIELDVLKCPFGQPSKQVNVISVARDIVGVSSTATTTQKQQAMKEFLGRHLVPGGCEFSFTISSFNTFLANQGMANMKIWGGNPPQTCNDFADPANPPRGVAVIVETSQFADNFPPLYKLSLSGHSTLTDGTGKIHEYIPAYSYESMLNPEKGTQTISSEELYAYVNANPYFPSSGIGGWTNKFKARGIASPGWTLKLRDPTNLFDFKGGQIKDIYIHLDTISQ